MYNQSLSIISGNDYLMTGGVSVGTLGACFSRDIDVLRRIPLIDFEKNQKEGIAVGRIRTYAPRGNLISSQTP
jgi:hypothetical protein